VVLPPQPLTRCFAADLVACPNGARLPASDAVSHADKMGRKCLRQHEGRARRPLDPRVPVFATSGTDGLEPGELRVGASLAAHSETVGAGLKMPVRKQRQVSTKAVTRAGYYGSTPIPGVQRRRLAWPLHRRSGYRIQARGRAVNCGGVQVASLVGESGVAPSALARVSTSLHVQTARTARASPEIRAEASSGAPDRSAGAR
jgi:hypothetical protein